MHRGVAILLAVLAAIGLLGSAPAAAQERGGIELGATRVIFNESAGKASMSVRNETGELRLMRTAVLGADAENRAPLERSSDFLSAPGVMLLKPDELAFVRIVRARKALPTDREGLYLLEMKFVPQSEGNAQVKTVLAAYVKIFYRPKAIERSGAVAWAVNRVRFAAEDQTLTLINPTPYWLTIKRVLAGGENLLANTPKSPMLAPFGELRLDAGRALANGAAPEITAITESGVETDPVAAAAHEP